MGKDIFNDLKQNKEKAEKKEQKESPSDNKNQNKKETENEITLTEKKEEKTVRRTYTIKKQNEKELGYAHRKTGRDKSEIVDIALDYFFDNVVIE